MMMRVAGERRQLGLRQARMRIETGAGGGAAGSGLRGGMFFGHSAIYLDREKEATSSRVPVPNCFARPADCSYNCPLPPITVFP